MLLSCLMAFSPPRRNERKVTQENRTWLMVLIRFCVFAVQMFRFGVFQGRLISDEGISASIAGASCSERYVGKSKHYAGEVRFFFTGWISRFRVFAD